MSNDLERTYRPAQQDWVCGLTIMQQSVLFAAIRNSDGTEKRHISKGLLRWYRRCVLLSAFDRKALTDPNEPGGGSFTGTLSNDSHEWTLDQAADYFLDSRDAMSLHYYAHAMHAFEIVGYKHPDTEIRVFWHGVYERMCHALHMFPESEAQMDRRLCDSEDQWRERNDPSATCSD